MAGTTASAASKMKTLASQDRSGSRARGQVRTRTSASAQTAKPNTSMIKGPRNFKG